MAIGILPTTLVWKRYAYGWSTTWAKLQIWLVSRYDPESILGIIPESTSIPYDIRELIMRIVDGCAAEGSNGGAILARWSDQGHVSMSSSQSLGRQLCVALRSLERTQGYSRHFIQSM